MARFVYALVHEEDGAYGISFPDFPGCVSGGRSLDEAVARGQEALAFHIAGMVEDGDPLPLPRSLGQLKKDAAFIADSEGAAIIAVAMQLPGRAVRINLSIDEALLESVDAAARVSGQSRSAFLAEAARTRLKGSS